MKLTHPESKVTVETDDPQQYLTQGWVEKAERKKAEPKSDEGK